MDWAVKLNGPISTEKFMGFMWPFSEGAVSKKNIKKKSAWLLNVVKGVCLEAALILPPSL
jgi:hypothetical protein